MDKDVIAFNVYAYVNTYKNLILMFYTCYDNMLCSGGVAGVVNCSPPHYFIYLVCHEVRAKLLRKLITTFIEEKMVESRPILSFERKITKN